MTEKDKHPIFGIPHPTSLEQRGFERGYAEGITYAAKFLRLRADSYRTLAETSARPLSDLAWAREFILRNSADNILEAIQKDKDDA